MRARASANHSLAIFRLLSPSVLTSPFSVPPHHRSWPAADAVAGTLIAEIMQTSTLCLVIVINMSFFWLVMSPWLARSQVVRYRAGTSCQAVASAWLRQRLPLAGASLSTLCCLRPLSEPAFPSSLRPSQEIRRVADLLAQLPNTVDVEQLVKDMIKETGAGLQQQRDRGVSGARSVG